MTPQVLVIGDDLTGSNATGARFARAGLRTISVSGLERALSALGGLASLDADIDVLVLNLGTRRWAAEAAREAVRAVVEALPPVPLLAKRVDTTLRGNVGAEVDELLTRLWPDRRALVVPAFPDAGRTTVGGLHLVDGRPLAESAAARDPLTPITHSRVATVLRHGTHRPVSEVPIDVVEAGSEAVAESLLATRAQLVVCDATTNAHLGTIAEAAAQVHREQGSRWISVDSGPFAVSLARALGLGAPAGAPVLAVVGSITATTSDQVAALQEAMGVALVDVSADESDARAIADRVVRNRRPDVRVLGIRALPPGAAAAESVVGEPLVAESVVDEEVAARVPGVLAEVAALLLAEHRFAGLYVTGGDVAEAVTTALGSQSFEIDTEVLPLAVAGWLNGGPHDGLPFATKGGLIGDSGAALACVEHLLLRSQKLAR